MKTLKTKLASVLLVAGVLSVIPFLKSAKADPAPRKHDFVVFDVQGYYALVNENQNSNPPFSYQWMGYGVINYEASPGAPRLALPVVTGDPFVPQTNGVAALLADLATQGFEIVHTDGHNYVLRR